MIKIEAIVQPYRLDSVKLALDDLGIQGHHLPSLESHGGSLALKAVYRGAEYQVDVPRVKLEMLVSSLQTDEVIDVILHAARTDGPGGDGTITIVTEIADAISTSEPESASDRRSPS